MKSKKAKAIIKTGENYKRKIKSKKEGSNEKGQSKKTSNN